MTDSNTELLLRVVQALGHLAEPMVFIGGCATALLVTDKAAPPLRATDDVDAIAEVETLAAYHRLGRELRRRGFSQALADGQPPYRWNVAGVKFDLMPIESTVLGFSNRWYRSAMETATVVAIGEDCAIRLITAPCLVATKLEAFRDRGGGDYMASHDLEDVMAVVDGRPELVDEVANAEREMRTFIASTVAALLADEGFVNALPGLVMDSGTAARASVLLARLRELAGISGNR